MGTITRTQRVGGIADWTFTYNCPNEVHATGSTIDVTTVISSVQAKWVPVYSTSSADAEVYIDFVTVLGKSMRFYAEDSAWAKNVTKEVELKFVGGQTPTPTNVLVNTSDFFNSSNPTTRRIAISTVNRGNGVMIGAGNFTLSDQTMTLADLVLDVPPTATVSAISYDKPFYYAGLTTATVTVSDVAAYYDGSISSVTFRIGQQTDTKSGNGTFSILLDTAGTFTPTVTVTDSRGQTYTKSFTPITVNAYSAPTVNFTADRTASTGVPDDEGTYATCPSTFIYADAIADLIAPSVVLTDENGTQTTPTVSWYTTRAADGTLSGVISDWSSVSAGDTVYGLVPGLNTNYSYQISIRPRDSQGTGTAITQTVASAFYTIDFLAGGHGIAFGQPSSQPGFECNMPTTFHDTADFGDAVYIELPNYQTSGVDKDIYDAVVALRWDSEVIV